MTVERVELRVLKYIEPGNRRGIPQELKILEKRVTWLPRVGFVILTLIIVVMVYATQI